MKSMAEWQKRSKKTDDVIFFNYVSDAKVLQSPLIYLWDIDKTYLDTKFETMRGLLRTATEKANQKKRVKNNRIIKVLKK